MNFLLFFADTALQSTALLAILLPLYFLLKRASAAEKHVALALGLAVVAVIPVGVLIGPRSPWSIHVPVRDADILTLTGGPSTQSLISPPSHAAAISSAPDGLPNTIARQTTASHATAGHSRIEFPLLLEILLISGASIQSLILLKQAWTWRLIRHSATPSPFDLASLSVPFATMRVTPALLLSQKVEIPILAGVIRPVIILPGDTFERPNDALLMILSHELAHLQRRDPLLLPLQWLLMVLYWWHPLAWLALARLRHECEIACDNLVLAHNFRPTDYATLLVDAARALRSSLPASAIAITASPSVSRRVLSILNPRVRRNPSPGWMIIAGSLFALSISGALMAMQLQPSQSIGAAFPALVSFSKNPALQVTFDLVFVDAPAYAQHREQIDAALATRNLETIAKLPGAYILSTPSHITEPGKQLQFANVTPMSVATGFEKDENGNLIPTGYRTQNLGPAFTILTAPSADNDSVKMQFKCAITYFKQWQQLPSGGRKPVFGKEVFWQTRDIHNGRALWSMPMANRYIPPAKNSGNTLPPNWPDAHDTTVKRMFVLVHAIP